MNLRESLNYEPKELAFGTSGLRGLVRDITQLEAYVNTCGFLQFCLATGQVRPGDPVCLAGDLRPSTEQRVPEQNGRGEILQAVARAISDSGLRVLYLGRIPSPALMHHALSRRLASVMVTGSHIPFDRNGIKFNKPSGEVLKADESAILTQVALARAREYARAAEHSPFDATGMLRAEAVPSLPTADPEGAEGYLQRYLKAFPPQCLQGRRLLVYQHSAVGRDLLVDLLRRLGADAIPAGRSEEFIPIDTEVVGPAMLAQLQALADEHGPTTLDAVVSVDGDSDRPLLLGLEGRNVRFFGGDLLGIVVADFLGARHIAVPISANDAVDRHFAGRGVAVVKTRIGSPHVIAAMQQVGWEANGGFLTAAPLRIPGGDTLEPLPTRDAFLPLLAALLSAFNHGRTVVQEFDRLPRRFGRSDVLRDFPRETTVRILARFSPTDSRVVQADFEPWTVTVRRSGFGAPDLADEALSAELFARKQALEARFSAQDGFSPVRTLNYLDGLRVTFANEEVVHIRPSGNAPELRLYVTAGTPERATAIMELAMVEGGILQALAAGTAAGVVTDEYKLYPVPLHLHGVVQHYAWGGTEFIPRLLGRANPEERPFAELWMGAHPSAPSVVDIDGGHVSLRSLIASAPDAVLGHATARRFGGQLPYLFKVLDVRHMLSIQVHPTLTQARAGFARETAAGTDLSAPHRTYKDENHKPEVHVALTPFWMLHGFRPLDDIADTLRSVAELRALMPDFGTRLAKAGDAPSRREALLQSLYERAMTLPQNEVDLLLDPLVRRLERQPPTDRRSPDYWVLRAAHTYARADGGRDRGLFSIYLLNLLRLEPGQGTYQPAGVLHAYLEGVNVELMANSDNVIRGGLTPKHVNVPELLQTVLFTGERPAVLRGSPDANGETVYQTAADEFELSRIALPARRRQAGFHSRSADCLLVLEGQLEIQTNRRNLTLRRGECAMVPAGFDYTLLAGETPAVAFRAAVPSLSP